MKFRNRDENFFRARRLRGGRIGAAIIAGVALVALAAMSPRVSFAGPPPPTVTLSPTSATNPTGAFHTVTAQVSGLCSANTTPTSCTFNLECAGLCVASFCDNNGVACTSDSDCGSTCDFTGVAGDAIGIGVVSGVNSGPTAPTQWTTVAADGTATVPLSYTSSVDGTDTIQGCLDTDSSAGVNDELTGTDAGDLAMCISDSGSEAGDIKSNQVTKTWETRGVLLTPPTATNPAGSSNTHTVTATVSAGKCVEILSGSPDGDEFAICMSNADCQDATLSSDDVCDKSGQTILFGVVTGPNASTTGSATTNSSGVAMFTYPDTGGVGIDTIRACLDYDADSETFSACVAESDVNDIASNTVKKRWFGPPTVTLTPSAAANATTTSITTSHHTVSAKVTGGKLGTCTAGTNIGAACDIATVATDCAGVSPVCDVSGYTIEFEAVSGPNAGDLGAAVTDVTGTATKTYADVLDGAGLDTLRSCLDVDDSETAAVCIAESGTGDLSDIASNTVVKRWEGTPTLTLKNLDQAATIASMAAGGGAVYTTSPAYNPVASTHTVQATIGTGSDADLGVCVGGSTPGIACDVNSDCSGGGTCSLAGYPVGFTVTSGPNTGDIGWAFTNTAGIATISYPDTGGAGQDSISSCLDTDAGIPSTPNDEFSVAACLTDVGTSDFGDYASNVVLKNWLSTFVTGGGKVVTGSKTWDTFGGVVGQRPGSTPAVTGEWDQVVHLSKGGNIQCHWNSFIAFALSCSTGSCGTQPDTVVFTTASVSGACMGLAGSQGETVKIIAPGAKPTTISVFSTTNAALSVGTPTVLVTNSGNFTIHK